MAPYGWQSARAYFECTNLSKAALQLYKLTYPEQDFIIPYICHFFYTDRIFENQILHPKKRLKSPKTLKMSLKKSYICIFFTHSGKIYTWQKIFTQTCLWCLWQIKGMLSTGDHWQCLSLTDSLTEWLTHFRLVNLSLIIVYLCH